MKIGVALSVRVAYHINGYAIDENGEVGAVVRVKAAKKNLIRLAAAVMLADE